MDGYGELYAKEVADNIVSKLRISLQIPPSEVSNERLTRFFTAKFQHADMPKFDHRMPDE